MRTIVITGASDGIGAAAARQLAGAGVRLIVVGRSPGKARSVASTAGAEHLVADFTGLDEVRELAVQLQGSCDRIDVLANNAGGVFAGPATTSDGFERTLQVNYLAPYLLTNLLMGPLLAGRATVVNTSSIAARLLGRIDLDDLNSWQGSSSNQAYANAKLANIFFTAALHERFHERGISAVAFHPGSVATGASSGSDGVFQRTYRGVLKRFLASPDQGGARLRHFIEGEPGRDWVPGEYYEAPEQVGRASRHRHSPEVVRELWERSADMLGVQW